MECGEKLKHKLIHFPQSMVVQNVLDSVLCLAHNLFGDFGALFKIKNV